MNSTLPPPEPRLYLSGNTYPWRDQIRAAGGRWDKERKLWHVPASASDDMRRLAAKARSLKRQASSLPPSEDQRIIGHGTTTKDKQPVLIAWMGRVKGGTGALMARLITTDGKRGFWASGKDLRVERRFEHAVPLAGILAQLQDA